MRKFLFLGLAAAAAFAGRGKSRSGDPTRPGEPRESGRLASLLPILFAPRWLKPLLLVRALAPRSRRVPPR